jgi:hypothetical protein
MVKGVGTSEYMEFIETKKATRLRVAFASILLYPLKVT